MDEQYTQFREQRLDYLKRRYNNVIAMLEAQSIDGRYTHKCRNYLVILGSSFRDANFDKNYDLDKLETFIVKAEHYLITIAQSL